MITILVADDEKNIRNGLQQALSENYNVLTATDGQEALAVIERHDIAAAIVDLRMPKVSGAEVLRHIVATHPALAVIMLTGHGSIHDAVHAMRNGAYDFLTKPVDLDHLAAVLHRAVEHRNLVSQNTSLRREVARLKAPDTIAAKSERMQEVMRIVHRAALSDISVLISGESGVGKELIADALHTASARHAHPLVKVHCAALSETLLESELFGHEKGAFTGAHSQRRGRFERAEHGTIFLDEIGEINPSIQVKLLRVLQDRSFERVGGEDTITVDARIIAATNRNLRAEVEAGRFREDLYYRLNVINIHVPPLRDRREDLLYLIHTLLAQILRSMDSPPKKFSEQAIDALCAYRWPGNIRELRNTLESAIVMSPNNIIEARHLPREIFSTPPVGNTIAIPIGSALEEAECRIIEETLRMCEGNKSRAAELLNIQRATLYEKIRRCRIDI